MLSKFFKPKWQHTNPAIRSTAAKKLSDDCVDEFHILSVLVTKDPDHIVRQTAIEQIASINNLIDLLEQSASDSDIIEKQLTHKLNAEDHPERSFDRLQHCSNKPAVWRVVCQTHFPDLQSSLIQQVDNQNQLLDIATSTAPISIRKTAAERITDPDIIEKLLKITRQKDKTIYHMMRDKSNALREQEKQQQARHALAENILEQIKSLANGVWQPLYAAKSEVISQEWQALGESVTATYQPQFSEAIDTCKERIKLINDKAAEEKQEHERIALVRITADELLEQLQAFITSLESAPIAATPTEEHLTQGFLTEGLLTEGQDNSISAHTLQFEVYQTQWMTITDDTSGAQQKTFNQLQQKFSGILKHASSIDVKLADISAFLATTKQPVYQKKTTSQQLKQAKTVLKKTAWPVPVERPEPLLELDRLILQLTDEQQQHTQKTAELSKKLQTQLEQLESAIDNGVIKAADKTSRKATELFSQLTSQSNGAINSQLEQQFKSLQTRLDELKDWQGFAVTPKKDQLCLDMENLIFQDLPAQEKAKQIKAFQQQWKMLDATDPFHSQTTWKRFKTASDKAYEPCEVFFGKQNEARSYNLQQKELIYKEVAAYLQQIEWDTSDWRAIEQIIQAAKTEWRRFVPVDRNPGQALQTKFNALLQDAEAHFQEAKECSMASKAQLIIDAEALTASEDVVAAAEQAKKLQKDWKECGPTFHSQERKLWKTFREHCDTIFQRLQEQSPSREAMHSAKLQLQMITDELLTFAEAPLHTRTKLNRLNEARQLIELYSESLPSQDIEKFNQAARCLEQQTKALTRLTEHKDSQSLLFHSDLCDRFEENILKNPLVQPLEDFFAGWTLNAGSSLNEKLISRRNQIELIAADEANLETLLCNSDRELRKICIRLEIALSLPSPEHDQVLRMEYLMQRLQQALDQQQSVNLTDIKKLEFESLSVPFRYANEALNQRLQTLIDTVFN
ncbi:DUF349 domain-containing protein [Neptunomonas antarctica]|uniref:DUF349 domain-containing protein n=1 Tax=Neptunomonas antarctica TaxID=619304 RepID=A0A1N7NLN9_9GAMM|nr:DUF349 domain-containing protein [Neptunomonas antarctica]SIS99089.1 protein of unknown function [Neptunomonas antarctica]